jgi:hypothetical protein
VRTCAGCRRYEEAVWDQKLETFLRLHNARSVISGACRRSFAHDRVDLQHNAYYYSQYYRREYSHYYQGAART